MSTQLKAQQREKVGTRQSRKLRTQGRIPASIQAIGEQPHLDISVDEADFMAARRHHEHVYELEVAGANETALIRELTWDVFGEKILHVEFRRVELGKATEIEVEIVFDGHAKGILNHVITHILVSAKPKDIPDSVELKIEGLEPGSHLTAADLLLPEGVALAVDPATAVANISELKAAAEPEEAADSPEMSVQVEGETPETPSEG